MTVKSSSLYILDVGHGNSAVLIGACGVVVIDAGSKNSLYLFLKQLGVSKIDLLLITHADEDHIAGTQTLIACEEFTIGKVLLNTDSSKDTKLWDDVLYALNNCSNGGRPVLDLGLTTSFTHRLGNVLIEIVAPDPYLAGKGPGSLDRKGRRISTNSSSAVVRISRGDFHCVLLASDIDLVGLNNLAESGRNAKAQIAVFPHHGGKPGKGNPEVFAQLFCNVVSPEIVLFSIGRGAHKTPDPSVIATLRKAVPNVRIACTQLSEHCASSLPGTDPPHLTTTSARGHLGRTCCAGTIRIILHANSVAVHPTPEDHSAFIAASAPTALCTP